MVRFISDLHINDVSMFRWRNDIKDVIEYSDLLISNWNSTVKDDDVTVVVGDIGHYCKSTVDVLKSLNGKKILVLGNHDIEWGSHITECNVFHCVYSRIVTGDLVITHVPISTYYSRYVIHGHHHTYLPKNMEDEYYAYVRENNRLNCCASLVKDRPRTLTELMMFRAICVEERR